MSVTTATHQSVANGSRVHHHLVPQLGGLVVTKGGNAWVTVRWDVIAQSAGTASGTVEAVHADNLVVVARPKHQILAESYTATEERKIQLRAEWRRSA